MTDATNGSVTLYCDESASRMTRPRAWREAWPHHSFPGWTEYRALPAAQFDALLEERDEAFHLLQSHVLAFPKCPHEPSIECFTCHAREFIERCDPALKGPA